MSYSFYPVAEEFTAWGSTMDIATEFATEAVLPTTIFDVQEFQQNFIDRIARLSPLLDEYLVNQLVRVNRRDGDYPQELLAASYNTATEVLFQVLDEYGLVPTQDAESLIESRYQADQLLTVVEAFGFDQMVAMFSMLNEADHDEMESQLIPFWNLVSDTGECFLTIVDFFNRALPLLGWLDAAQSLQNLLTSNDHFAARTRAAFDMSTSCSEITPYNLEQAGMVANVVARARAIFATIWSTDPARLPETTSQDINRFANGCIAALLSADDLVDGFAQYVKTKPEYMPFYVGTDRVPDEYQAMLVACTARAWVEATAVASAQDIEHLLKDAEWLLPVTKLSSEQRSAFIPAFARFFSEFKIF